MRGWSWRAAVVLAGVLAGGPACDARKGLDMNPGERDGSANDAAGAMDSTAGGELGDAAPDAAGGGDAAADCVPGATGTRFVDHGLGTDDAAHGSGPGRCAYRTLTYALGRAPGEISLAEDSYQGTVAGEALPFLLTGEQSLSCNGASLENEPNQGTYEGIVQFAGTRNAVTGCNFDGGHVGGYCLIVNATAGDPARPHSVTQSTFTKCDNVTLVVPDGFNNLRIADNTFTLNFASIYFEGDHTNISVVNNTFVGNESDVMCDLPASSITGSGNVRGGGSIVCSGCAACPF